jgi:hypothetical protein
VRKNAYTHMYLCAENANMFDVVQHSRRRGKQLAWPSQSRSHNHYWQSSQARHSPMVEWGVLQIVKPGELHLKCKAHNLMTETMSLWTISIVSKDK